MAWRDVFDTFSDEQAVTASAISDVKVISQGYTGVNQTNTVTDIGQTGTPLYWVVQVDESATAAGAATVTFSLESDSTADLATSATVHVTTSAIGKATLVAGYKFAYQLPRGSYEKYLGTRYTVATGPLTAGKFSAYLTNALDSNIKVYAIGSEIA